MAVYKTVLTAEVRLGGCSRSLPRHGIGVPSEICPVSSGLTGSPETNVCIGINHKGPDNHLFKCLNVVFISNQTGNCNYCSPSSVTV